MYFVVQLLNPKISLIVPKTWVKGIDGHWEKFVNRSINRNQVFLCFYSEKPEALDDTLRPNGNFVPNFDEMGENFPDAGCYHAKLLWYKGMQCRNLYNIT